MSPTRRRRGSRTNKPSAAQLRDFWGDDVDDPVDDEPIRVITPGVDPTALVESLGPLPFPGAGVAPHYFQAVYERAAGLAVALAAAAGLLDLSAPDPDPESDPDPDPDPDPLGPKGSDLARL